MATAPTEKPTGLALLRVPFADNHISKLPKPTKAQTDAVRADSKKGIRCKLCDAWHHPDVVHLDYVGHAALTDRLLDADPNWSWAPMALDERGLPAFDRDGGLWINLTVCGQSRPGYGHPDGKTGGNAIKEAIGDALRNAAMRFGAALDLWHKGDLHADEETAPEQQTGMPDTEWAKLVQLIEATNADRGAMLKLYGVDNLRQLNQNDYADAIQKLTAKLAKMAKAQTEAKAREEAPPPPPPPARQRSEFAEVLADEIPF